jgi:hypothetical protein
MRSLRQIFHEAAGSVAVTLVEPSEDTASISSTTRPERAGRSLNFPQVLADCSSDLIVRDTERAANTALGVWYTSS